MNKLDKILDRIRLLNKWIKDLDHEYEVNDKIKGRAYEKKLSYLAWQINAQLDKLDKLGKEGTLFKIELGIIDTKAMDIDPDSIVNVYLQNISKKNINTICEIKYKGYSLLRIEEIPLGVPIKKGIKKC